MITHTRTTAAVAIAASLLFFAGCSSPAPAAEDTSAQVDEAAADEATADDTTEDVSTDDATVSEEDPGPAGGAVYTDPAADSVQVALSASGFDPSVISVAVGGTVTFTPSDDGPHGLYVGDLDSYSAMGGLTATFRFDVAGTYRVFDEITETEATVTAK